MTATPHGTKYRPEIDGLRAVAVLVVIFYHAGFPGFSGGFVGVDVFFVISGFLITQIIVADVQHGRFSIADFYERRARRILPALFVVLLATTAAAFAWMAPAQLKGYSASVVAVALFASNFLLTLTTGYFEGGVEELALLHTWSLAVEEQFYVVFPLFMAALWRRGLRSLVWWIVGIALASLALSEWLAHDHPTANFYLAPSRAWELLIGALLALAWLRGPLHARVARVARELLAGTGLLMIAAAVAAYTGATPFPSVFALLPTVGTALVIAFATPETLAGRFLTLRWMLGIGLVSYSAYLWHQPLFAFGRILTVGQVGRGTYMALIIANFVLAHLTWKYVEAPFRNKRRFSRPRIFAWSIAGSLAFVAIGSARFLVDRDNHLSYEKRVNYGLSSACEFGDSFTPIEACRTSPSPKVLVWGDSFGMHIVAGLTASDSTIALVQATKSLCAPFLHIGPVSLADRQRGTRSAEECMRFNNSVFTYLSNHPLLETVVISSPFRQYVDSTTFDLLAPDGMTHASLTLATRGLSETIERLRKVGKHVVIIAPPPAGNFNMGNCIERQRLHMPIYGPARGCVITLDQYRGTYGPVLALLDSVEHRANVSVIRFDSLLCDSIACRTTLDGVPIYRDVAHFSYAGITYIGRKMDLANRVRMLAK